MAKHSSGTLKFLRQGPRNCKSGFRFRFDSFTFREIFTLNVSIVDEDVTRKTWCLALLILLSATEHATQTVNASRILIFFNPKFILILSSHQHSPFRHINSTFPNNVALRNVKQTCEIYLSNDCKQERIVVLKRNFLPIVVLCILIVIFYINLFRLA